jgi:hypothetical protein
MAPRAVTGAFAFYDALDLHADGFLRLLAFDFDAGSIAIAEELSLPAQHLARGRSQRARRKCPQMCPQPTRNAAENVDRRPCRPPDGASRRRQSSRARTDEITLSEEYLESGAG